MSINFILTIFCQYICKQLNAFSNKYNYLMTNANNLKHKYKRLNAKNKKSKPEKS